MCMHSHLLQDWPQPTSPLNQLHCLSWWRVECTDCLSWWKSRMNKRNSLKRSKQQTDFSMNFIHFVRLEPNSHKQFSCYLDKMETNIWIPVEHCVTGCYFQLEKLVNFLGVVVCCRCSSRVSVSWIGGPIPYEILPAEIAPSGSKQFWFPLLQNLKTMYSDTM